MKLSDFDFEGKRVKYQGKVMSKFALSQLIGMIEPYCRYSMDSDYYPYSVYAWKLKMLLSR